MSDNYPTATEMPDDIDPEYWGPHTLAANRSGSIHFQVRAEGQLYSADLARDAFLDAVRKLGVIVIDKATLPDVARADGELMVDWQTVDGVWQRDVRYASVTTENLRRRAHALLAIAEEADVADPAKAEALAALLRASGNVVNSEAVARALLASGKIEVTE